MTTSTVFDDDSRVAALHALGVLDTPPEERFERLTRLASALFGAPIALVSLVDRDRQWFKASVGLDATETPRNVAFCSHAVEQGDMLVVPDATRDARFATNPLVTGAPHIRFYAGQPVFAASGHALGTLCVIDRVARDLDPFQRQCLRDLAALVADELNMGVIVRAREAAEQRLKQLNDDLERRVEERTELLDAILSTVDVGVVACSADGRLTMFNQAARDFHGLPPDAIDPALWAQHYDLFDADGVTRLEREQIPLFRALTGETIKDAAMVIAPKGRPPRTLLASGRPLIGSSGEPLGAVVAMKDVTELAESRARAAQNELRLRAITENLPTLIGQVDSDGMFTFLNSQAARFYGRASHELIGRPVRSAYTASEYATIAPYIESAMAGKRASFESDILVHGSRMYFHASYIPDLDQDGKVHGFFAMAFDITARRRSEIRQRESEERLRTITDNLPVLISYVGRDLKYGFANALYEQWYGVAPAQMLGRTMTEVFGDEFYAARATHLARCFDGNTVQLDLELHSGAEPRTVQSVLIPHLRDGEVLGAYVLTSDVTAARLYEQQLKTLALTDALTGLANRRSYELLFEGAIRRAHRSGERLALMYLDIDKFKEINDTFGHAGGDEVLTEFARRLVGAVRKTDTVCRLAGDEFTIVLEGVRTLAQCETIGHTILEAIRVPFAIGDKEWNVTTSIGIAWSAGGESGARRLSDSADGALYQAKAAGRNRFAVVAQTE
jgi:diguanylate cyclase (GGDEF)-like protein/PAS domain S-box-containing protein